MTRLTESQLERAARKLCELRGVDPNSRIYLGVFDDDLCNWQKLAREIRDHESLDLALRFGRGDV